MISLYCPVWCGVTSTIFLNSWRTPWWFFPAKALPSEHPVAMSKGIPEPKQRCISPKSATKCNKSLTFLDHDENKWRMKTCNIIWNIFWTYREFTRPWLPKHVIQAPMLAWSKPENGAAMKNNGFNKFPLRFNGKFLDRFANCWTFGVALEAEDCCGSTKGSGSRWKWTTGHQPVQPEDVKPKNLCCATSDWLGFLIFPGSISHGPYSHWKCYCVPCWTLMLTLPRSEAVFTSFYLHNKPNLLSPSTSFCNFWLQLSILVQSLALQRRVAASQSELGLHLRAACFESSARCQWRLDWTMAW